MDEELLGIGVESDSSGLTDLEEDMFASVDRIDEHLSNRVIDGPTVRPPEPDLTNVEHAAAGVQAVFDEVKPTITPDITPVRDAVAEVHSEVATGFGDLPPAELTANPAPALEGITQVLRALNELKESHGQTAIQFEMEPHAAVELNTALHAIASDADLAAQGLLAFRDSALPALEALGLSAEQAAPLVQQMWDALRQGQLVAVPAAEGLAAVAAAKERLALAPTTPIVDPAQTGEVEHLSNALAEATANLDAFNRRRAESQVADPITGNVPVAPLPRVVPDDLPEQTRQLQILGSGLADVGREAEETKAKISSLRETFTEEHQTTQRVTRENHEASQALTDLGANLRRASDASHNHAEGLTFEGLALRRATQAMAGLAAQSLEAEGPVFAISEALLGLVVPHAAILAGAAAVAALASAWNLVHEAARRAKEEENQALQAFIKTSEARDLSEQQASINTQARDILGTQEQQLRLAAATSLHYGNIIGFLLQWVDLQKTINLHTALNEAMEREAARQRTQDVETKRTGALNLNAQGAAELDARRQQIIRIGEAEAQSERQLATQRAAMRQAEAGNALAGAEQNAQEQSAIDREFFAERTRLAQESATSTRESLEQQLADLRASEPKSGQGLPEETQQQKNDRAARIQGLEAQLVLVRVQLAFQLQQIQAEHDLANATRDRTLQQARLAEDARTHAERVAAGGGGNRPADFGGVGIIPTLAPNALALTNEQLRLLEANIKPLEIPIILQGANTRETLDVVGQELKGRQEDAARFAAGLNAVAEAGGRLSGVAENLNIISEEMATVLHSTFELIGGLSQVQLASVHFQQATDRAGRFAAELEKIGGIVSIIGSAVGVVAGIGHALFGGENEHDRLLRQNTDALERNTAQREVQQRFAGIGGLVEFEQELQTGLTNFREAFAEREQRIAEITSHGVDRPVAELQVDPLRPLEAQLADAGLSLEDLTAIAEQVAPGLEVVDENGHLVAGALDQLNQAVEDSIVAQFKWQQTFDDQQRRIALESRLAGTEQTPEQQFRNEIDAAIASGSTAIQEAFAGIDLGDPAAVRQRLQELERAFRDQTLDFQDIGHLTRDQWLQFLEDGADFLDTFNDAVSTASDQLSDLNVPEGFRRAAIAFATGSPPPEPVPPEPPLTFPGGPIVEPRHPDTGVTIPENTDAVQQQTDATAEQTDATHDATEVQERAIASTDTLVTAMDRQHDATLDLIATLESFRDRTGTAPPGGDTGTTSLTGGAGAPRSAAVIHGGLHVQVMAGPGGAPASLQVQQATIDAVREALHQIGLVQTGDTLQFPVY